MVKPDELTHKHKDMKHNKVKARKIAKIAFLAGFVIGGSLAAIFHDHSAQADITPDMELRWEIVRMQEEIQALENWKKHYEQETPKEEPKYTGIARVTAYSCLGITTDAERKMNCPNGITATGTIPDPERTVACGPNYLGKTILIEGIGERVCEDRGGAIHDGFIDLYVENIQEAYAFGVKNLQYKVLF